MAYNNILKFFDVILPEQGYYFCAGLETSNKKFIHQTSCNSKEALAEKCWQIVSDGYDTSYAFSSFDNKKRKCKETVRVTKVIAIDIDCGPNKHYDTQISAIEAVCNFNKALNLPYPLFVNSGNGLHVYWLLEEELKPKDWNPLVAAFGRAVQDKGLNIDKTLVNGAQFLRPIGTFNRKGGLEKPVELFKTPVNPQRKSVLIYKDRLSAYYESKKLNSYDLATGNAHKIAMECNQVRKCLEDADTLEYPLWFELIGVAKYCNNSEDVAILWSKSHPQYSRNETLSKLRSWSKPAPLCSTFENIKPARCNKCQYKGRIKTPVQIGIQYEEKVTNKNDLPKNVITSIVLPKPFKRTANGVKVTIDDTDIDVCDFDLYPVNIIKDEYVGYDKAIYSWQDKHGDWQELVLNLARLNENDRNFADRIAEQGILLSSAKQTGIFQQMLRAYTQELLSIQRKIVLYSTMGWKHDYNSFCLGNTILRNNDGKISETKVDLTLDQQKQKIKGYECRGNFDTWLDLTNQLQEDKLFIHMFILGVSLSAPLYTFGGLKGLVVSLCGHTGGGKTLAQYLAQSVYGRPEILHILGEYTPAYLYDKLSEYSNLPVTIDEVTEKLIDKDIGSFIFSVSEGNDKGRLDRSAKAKPVKTWALPVIVSTNFSLHSKLVSSGRQTDGQLARLLELTVPVNNRFAKNSLLGKKIYSTIHENYGYAGKKFIRKLLELGNENLHSITEQSRDLFHKKYGVEFSGHERYWEQAIIYADLSMAMAKKWNIIEFDYTAVTNWILDQLELIRKTVRENKVDSFDIVSEYMSEFGDSHLIVIHTANKDPEYDVNRLPKKNILVRLDIYRRSAGAKFNRGIMMIHRSHFRKWLSHKGHDYNNLTADFIKEKALVPIRNDKASMGKGTPIRLSQNYVIALDLSHSRLSCLLNNTDEYYANISLVKNNKVEQNA